jgi:hypothetical protein
MIRRILWLLIIMGLAYGIYYRIDPIWAEDFVARIQTYFADDRPVQQELEEDSDSITGWITYEDDKVQRENIVYTWVIDTWSSVELDYVLNTTSASTGSEVIITGSDIAITGSSNVSTVEDKLKKPKPSSKQSLSNQDKEDLRMLLDAIVE